MGSILDRDIKNSNRKFDIKALMNMDIKDLKFNLPQNINFNKEKSSSV